MSAGTLKGSEYAISVAEVAPGDAAWASVLEQAGGPVPLYHRPEWWAVERMARWGVVVRDGSDEAVAALPVKLTRWRALPGHRILRAVRVRPEHRIDAVLAAVEALTARVGREARLVRMHVEVFSLSQDLRRRFGNGLSDLGFVPAQQPRIYGRTRLIDLTPSEDAIFSTFHATGRRHVRAVGKRPLCLGVVEDRACAPVVRRVLEETMRRTGGPTIPWDWGAAIELTARRPDLARLVGLFRGERPGPEAMVAFAFGVNHGDHVEYAAAGSVRADDLRMPLGYAPVWELIRWAKKVGASVFDFGGITIPVQTHASPVDGISEFKRYFGGREVEVGEEWVLEPSRLRTSFARAVTHLSTFFGAPS